MRKQQQESLWKKPTHGEAATILLALLFDSMFLERKPKSCGSSDVNVSFSTVAFSFHVLIF